MLPNCFWDAFRFLLEWFQNSTGMFSDPLWSSSGILQDASRFFFWDAPILLLGSLQIPFWMLPEFYRAAFGMFLDFFWNAFRTLPSECFLIPYRMLPDSFWDASILFLACYQILYRMLSEIFWNASKILQGCFQIPYRCCWDISRILKECYQNPSGLLPESFWDASRFSSGLLPYCFWDPSRFILMCFRNSTGMLPDSL